MALWVTCVYIQTKLIIMRIVWWIRWHCPPDRKSCRTLEVWGPTRYLIIWLYWIFTSGWKRNSCFLETCMNARARGELPLYRHAALTNQPRPPPPPLWSQGIEDEPQISQTSRRYDWPNVGFICCYVETTKGGVWLAWGVSLVMSRRVTVS